MNSKVLIIGGTGQLGFYLAKNLKHRNIYISTRKLNTHKNYKFLKDLKKKVTLIELNPLIKKKTLETLKFLNPTKIYYLSGQSSVGKSFKTKNSTIKSNLVGCQNLLESIKSLKLKSKFINFSSSEIFKYTPKKININSVKLPVSPYGYAKYKSFNLTRFFRQKHKIRAYNAVLFNCESIRRPNNFLFPKICNSALNAALSKNKKKFIFGNIDIIRDWGSADEYMHAVIKYTNLEPQDFIVATGKSFSIRYLLNFVFKYFNLDYRKYIIQDKKYFRKNEVIKKIANIDNLRKEINFVPKKNAIDVIKEIISYKLNNVDFNK